jgi:ribosomal protein S11
VTDIKGNPKISLSAGLINLTKRQKKTQPMALINIFKILLLKARFLKDNPIALHFKNTKPYYESLIIRVLKDKLYIKSIQSYNLSPHNGCRPKKIKRIKRRTKRMVLR